MSISHCLLKRHVEFATQGARRVQFSKRPEGIDHWSGSVQIGFKPDRIVEQEAR